MPTILSSFFLIFSAVFVIVAIPSVRAAVISAPPYVLNLSNGLVAYWTFDGKDTPWTSSTAATTLDKSGNGNTGTLTNMNQSTAPVPGKIGQALKFDGSSGYVSASPISSLTDNLTFSAWLNWTGVNTTLPIPFYNGDSGPNGYGVIISGGGCSLGNYIGILLGNVTCDVLNSTYTLPSNQWVLVTIERNAGTWYLYVNGNLVVTGGIHPQFSCNKTYYRNC